MAQQKLFLVPKIVVCLWIFLMSSSLFAQTSDLKFQRSKIKIGSQLIDVDLAKSASEQARGLMYVKKIPDNYGMLFIYEDSDVRHFWMKNTLIPLSIGFFDSNKRLFQVKDMRPMKSLLVHEIDTASSSGPAMYALEVNQGWFKKNNIPLGSKFEWIKDAGLRNKKETKESITK